MLYLAEVQKQRTFIGNAKAELKLLACQRAEHNWIAVAGEEVIAAPEEFNTYNPGALVLVDMGANRQVQKIPEGARQLVNVLQDLSRQLTKTKKDAQEIEDWKQSLTYQSQVLNRREMELEALSEELQRKGEELERLESQRQEVNKAREEVNQSKQELERSRHQLEKTWEQLRAEERRLQEQQQELESRTVLDPRQAGWIQELIDRISGASAPTNILLEQLNLAFEVVNNQQATLDYYWQQLEQQQSSAQQMQAEVDNQSQEIHNHSQEWEQTQAILNQAQTELKVQQNALEIKQQSAQMLRLQLQQVEDLYQLVNQLGIGSDYVKATSKVDVTALEKMSLGELQETVQNFQYDLEKLMRFVNDQEEELTDKRQTIQELKQNIGSASQYDRIRLETELADEQDAYQMLDKTLQGQREYILERQEILKQHVRVLRRQQGLGESDGTEKQVLNIEPIVNQLEVQRQQQGQELQKLESQIEHILSSIQQTQEMVDSHEGQDNSLQALKDNLHNQSMAVAQLWGKVNLYQETLPPIQENLNAIRQKLEALAQRINQMQETGNSQLGAISDLQEIINSLIQTP